MPNDAEISVWTEVPDAGVAEVLILEHLKQFYPGRFEVQRVDASTILVGTADTLTAILLAMRINRLKVHRMHLEACYEAPAAECIEF